MKREYKIRTDNGFRIVEITGIEPEEIEWHVVLLPKIYNNKLSARVALNTLKFEKTQDLIHLERNEKIKADFPEYFI